MKQYMNDSMRCCIYLFCLTLFTVMWTGCSNEDDSFVGNDEMPGGKTLAVQLIDNGFDSSTDAKGRALENENFVTTFTEGDKIGVYVVLNGELLAENVCMTYTDGQWQGTLYDEGDNANYFAYYPYDANISSETLALSAENAETFLSEYIREFDPLQADSYTKGDLMTGEGSVVTAGNGVRRVEFTMGHRMSLLVVQLPTVNYSLSTDADYTWKGDVPGVAFTGFSPYSMSDGSYRCLFNPDIAWTETCSVSYSGELGTQTYTFVNSELNSIASGHYLRYIVDKEQSRTITHTLQIGDFYMSNGGFVSKDAELTEYQKEQCIGVVYWLGDATVDDAVLRAEHSGCTHGLVVSLFGEQNIAWQDNFDYDSEQEGESVGDWIKNDEECQNKGIVSCQTDYEVEDVINKILGYNNTKGIELFNDAHAGSLVNPVAKVVEYRKNVPAPANSSDWFVPSAKELSLMTTGEVSDVWWDDYNTEICDLIRMQFAKLGENYAQDFSNFGWSSSEYLLDLPISPDLRSSRAYGVWFVDGAIDYDGKANDRVEARFILAF